MKTPNAKELTICGMLPYGVHVELEIGIEIPSESFLVTYESIEGVLEYNRKPILFPFDLTKEITVNGETFIPVIEISKIVDNGHNHENSKFEIYSNKIIVSTGKCDDVHDVHFWFRDGILVCISRHSLENIMILTWMKIESKLNEWKINWRNLPVSEFVDVNSLGTNPYK